MHYKYTINVSQEDIDLNGHVSNITYLEWMIEAATRHSDAVGYGFDACHKLGGMWVAKSHHIEYKRPVFAGETLRMETWVEDTRNVMSVRRYVLTRCEDGAVVCEGRTEWVYADLHTMRPKKIPPQMKAAFEGGG